MIYLHNNNLISMGKTSSKSNLESYKQNFEVYSRDPHHQLIYLIEKNTKEEYILKQIFAHDRSQMKNIQTQLIRKKTLKHQHLVSLQQYYIDTQQFCNAIALYKFPFRSLEQQRNERIQQGIPFQQNQLWSILASLILGFSYLQRNGITHGQVRSSNIYVQENGVIKIADPFAKQLSSNFELAKQSSFEYDREIYLSPNELESLRAKLGMPRHNPYKTDVFTLGMIILELALLRTQDSVYKNPVGAINKNEILESLEECNRKYSGQLTSTIRMMVQIDQDKRLDWNELQSFVKKQDESYEFSKEQSNIKSNSIQSFSNNKQQFQNQIIIPQNLQKNNLLSSNQKILALDRSNQKRSFNNNINISKTIDQQQVIINNNKPIINSTNMYPPPPAIFISQVPNNQQQIINPTIKNSNKIITNYSNNNLIINNPYQFPVINKHPNFATTQIPKIKLNYINSAQNIINQNPKVSPNQRYLIPGNSNQILKSGNQQSATQIKNVNLQQNIIYKNKNQVVNVQKNTPPPISTPTYHSFPQKLANKNIKSPLESRENNNPQKANVVEIQKPNIIQTAQTPNSAKKNTKPIEFNNNSNKNIPDQKVFITYNTNEIKQITEVFKPPEKQQQYQDQNSIIENILPEIQYQSNMNKLQHQKSNKPRYEGEYYKQIRHGFGKYYFEDGGVYQGQWNYNRMQGFGKLYYIDGELAYEGNWFQDHFHGAGKLFNQKKNFVKRSVDCSNLSNIDEIWKSYNGNFEYDAKHGKGILTFWNDQKFEGNFQFDYINGEGIFYGRDKTIQGYWEKGKLKKNY